MTSPADRLETLLRLTLATEPKEIDCDELLARVSGYLESLKADAERPPELGAVAQHLAVCPECREEFEALLRAYEP